MSQHLLVIEPVINDIERQGSQEVMHGWTGTVRHVRPALRAEDVVRPGDGYEGIDGVVVMGSAASVYDPLPWLDELKGWMRPLLSGEVGIPVLGICFGHQLIASLEGGEVSYLNADQSKRKGVEESVVASSSRLLGVERRLRVVVSHRQVVTRVPRGYRPVATRPGVPFDGFDHETLPIHTVQFHPEARNEFASRVGIEDVVDERVWEDGRLFIQAFHRLVASR